MDIPVFKSITERNAWLVTNKSMLISQKKFNIKRADAFSFASRAFVTDEDHEGEEAAEKGIKNPSEFTGDKIQVKLVINTTKLMDSHSDVHIDGLWKKSLKENKSIYLLEEHNMSFRGIISDEVKADAVNMTWKSLGYKHEGDTQALVFDCSIQRKRNEYMFGEYVNGHVKNHSVGMRYVKLALALNDENYKEEHSVWKKYIDLVANRKDAETQGYFWAVEEAKVIEGSAVVIGSNTITPTLSVEEKSEPSDDTQKETGAGETTPPTLTDEQKLYYLKTLL